MCSKRLDPNAAAPAPIADVVKLSDSDEWLDEALQETFPASDPVPAFHRPDRPVIDPSSVRSSVTVETRSELGGPVE